MTQLRQYLPKNFHTLRGAERTAALSAGIAAENAAKAARKLVLDQEKAERSKAAMHCQVCGRDILANKGHIAHHGYTRPGDGWQTPSCGGAKELPFEVSRDALGTEIEGARNYVKLTREFIERLKAETAPVSINYQEYDKIHYRYVNRALRDVTRETFDAIKEANPEVFKDLHGPRDPQTYITAPYTFDIALAKQVAIEANKAQTTEDYANHQQVRYDGWKQTHEWKAGTWAALSKEVA